MPISASDLVVLRLPPDEALDLSEAAAGLGLSPDEWLRCLVRAHLYRDPQWSPKELDSMADAAAAIHQIADLVRQDDGDPTDRHLPHRVLEAFMQRVAGVAEVRRAYWGIDRITSP